MTGGRTASETCEDPGRLLAYAALLRREGRELECRVEGDSMGATLPASSFVRIRLIAAPGASVGRVMAFVARARVVSHRAIWIGRGRAARGYLLTAGDGNLLPDPPVSETSILGPVTEVLIDGKWAAISAPSMPAWRRLTRLLTASLVGGVMEVSVPAARLLATSMIRVRRVIARASSRPASTRHRR